MCNANRLSNSNFMSLNFCCVSDYEHRIYGFIRSININSLKFLMAANGTIPYVNFGLSYLEKCCKFYLIL